MHQQHETIFNPTGELVKVCYMPVKGVSWKEAFLIGNVVLFFALPFLILVYIYGCIMYCLLTKNEELLVDGRPMTDHSKRLRKQVVIMLIAVVVLFFICLTPFRVIMIWYVYVESQTLEEFGNEAAANLLYACRILYLINSAGNPILYNIFSSKFRIAFKNLLCPKYRQRANSFITTRNGSLSVRLTTVPKMKESASDTAVILSQKIEPYEQNMLQGHLCKK